MKHFIPACQDESRAVLGPDEIHYLLRVRRLSPGDELVCVDHGGRIWRGRIVVESSGTSIVRTSSVDPLPLMTPGPEIHLVQGVPKGRKIDDIIRQACELGVTEIHLWQSRHSIPKLDEKWETREKRLSAIVREAAQQSGNMRPPLVHAPESTKTLIETMKNSGGMGLVFYEKHIAEASLHGYLSGAPDKVYLFIGPEGGIAPDELDLFMASGCRIASLGQTILRTETAGIVAVAAVRMIMIEKKYWKPV